MTAQIPQAAPTDRTGGIYTNTVFGIVAYLKTPRLRGLLAVYFAVSSVGAMIIVNTVVLTRGILGGTELLTTSFLACAGAGSMCAAFLIPRLIERVGERHLMLAGIVAAAVAMLLGGALMISDFASIFAFAILWLIAGAGTTFAQTPGGRLVQRSAGDGDRSAFFAANFALSHGVGCLLMASLAGLEVWRICRLLFWHQAAWQSVLCLLLSCSGRRKTDLKSNTVIRGFGTNIRTTTMTRITSMFMNMRPKQTSIVIGTSTRQ